MKPTIEQMAKSVGIYRVDLLSDPPKPSLHGVTPAALEAFAQAVAKRCAEIAAMYADTADGADEIRREFGIGRAP